MRQLWQDCKSYFGDGFVPASSPLRYDVHVCDIKRPAVKNDNHHYGVELDEDTLPLFTAFGEVRPPPCSCYELPALVKYIDDRLQTIPESHAADYSLHSGKGETSQEEAGIYALRDALSWWVHWQGVLTDGRWKHLYVAFATIPDDLQVPPRHLADGSWRYLGYTLAELLDGLRSEGVHPDDVKLAEMCLLRQYILQYLEKVDPGLRAMLVGKTTLMTQFRNITANTHGVGVVVAAARGVQTGSVSDEAVEMAAIGNGLSLDMAKEAMGILKGEKTETVAGNRQLMNEELRWVYARCMIHLDSQPNSHILRRYASSAFHFAPCMDRYLERLKNARWSLTPAMRRLIGTYVKENVTVYNDM